MRRTDDTGTRSLLDQLKKLITGTKAAKLTLATQLLQMAHIEILMSEHDIAQDEIDELRGVLERQADGRRVLNLDELRQSRQQAVRKR